jgi:hypothetical protein
LKKLHLVVILKEFCVYCVKWSVIEFSQNIFEVDMVFKWKASFKSQTLNCYKMNDNISPSFVGKMETH